MATRSSILAWENPMDGGAWWATVHGVENSRTQLSMHAVISKRLHYAELLKCTETQSFFSPTELTF